MTTRFAAASMFFLAVSPLANAKLRADTQPQSVALDKKLQIPGTVLEPGTYIFAVEDTVQDRTVVRITRKDGDQHYLVLTVRSDKLPSATGQNGLIFFNNPLDDSKDADREVLRGWRCTGCSTTLEFVYPKLEAQKITADSGQSALGADAEPDNLPVKLSGDDLKVVKLWLLSPTRVMPEESARNTAPEATTSAARTERTSPARVERPIARKAEGDGNTAERLPNTASNKFVLGLLGIVALLGSAGLGWVRIRKVQS